MIDVRQNGIGDIVVACWIVHSAAAVAERVRLNPRNHRTVATVLGVPDDCLTRDEAADWSQTLGIGHQFEYQQVDIAPMSRFDAWSYSLGLPGLRPVRPPYRETPEDAAWAEEQWHKVERVESDPGALKVPFFHNNDDYDEVIFYHAGNFFSRDNIHPGMVTLHPAGFTHGPHPKALKNMLTQSKPATDEVAVMIDARDALEIKGSKIVARRLGTAFVHAAGPKCLPDNTGSQPQECVLLVVIVI